MAAVFALELDPDLGQDIEPDEWGLARQACGGELMRVVRGAWSPALDSDVVGFVVAGGMLAREACLRDRCMVELLGPCDAFHPPAETSSSTIATPTRLTALTDVRLLVLRRRFLRAAARWPSLLTRLHGRMEMQRESLAIQGLITHLPKAEDRILLMLRHLADRWGYVRVEGTILPLPLSHYVLGQLIGARRSTVTLALNTLTAKGAVRRREDGSWLLTPVADPIIKTITRAPKAPSSLGERLMLARMAHDAVAETRALAADPHQIHTVAGQRAETDGAV